MNACIPDSADLPIGSRRCESRAGQLIELRFEGPCRGRSRIGCSSDQAEATQGVFPAAPPPEPSRVGLMLAGLTGLTVAGGRGRRPEEKHEVPGRNPGGAFLFLAATSNNPSFQRRGLARQNTDS
jgi:hypothetical protein